MPYKPVTIVMTLNNKIRSVNRLFARLDNHIAIFKEKSGLSCIPDCGMCCNKEDINATILEFLPAAMNFYLSGVYEDILDIIENKTDDICIFYDPSAVNGNCAAYNYRGLICRLFGFASRQNKYGDKALVTCKIIKSRANDINNCKYLSFAPDISAYYMKLFYIDPSLSMQQMPLNKCIKKAIEIVELDTRYRRKPA